MSLTILRIPGADAIRTLEERRAAFPKSGEYPFLIGTEEALVGLQETMRVPFESPEELIELAGKFNAGAWFSERRREWLEDNSCDEDELLGSSPDEPTPKTSLSVHRKGNREVVLGLVRIAQPWHLPAALNYGGWNSCPPPEIQCALHRRWQEAYGAEIVAVSGDVIECAVSRPPTTHDAALKLAWEQYRYCEDIVDQGCGSIHDLAGTLRSAPYWFFWWD